MKQFLTILVSLLVVAPTIVAQDGLGLSLLRIEHGARAAGMGATFSPNDWDPNLVAYNPAAAHDIKQFTGSFGHTEYWENIALESGYVWTNLTDRLAFHAGVRYAAISDIEARTEPSAQPIGLFNSEETSIKAGLSYKITPIVAIGASFGWYLEQIDIFNGAGFNVDFGLLASPWQNVVLGASVTSLGSDITLSEGGIVSDEIALPTTYRVGGSYHRSFVTGAADLVVVDDEAHLHVGADAILHELFSLRTGYMSGYDSKNFTAGASFTPDKVRIDYAFLPFSNNLGTSHMFTLSFKL